MTASFLLSAESFLEKLFSSLTKLGVSFSSYPVDHLCYRVSTHSRYQTLKAELQQVAKLLDEVNINGRPIATYQLDRPIRFRNSSIALIELPAPKPSKAYDEGFEHAEFVVGRQLDHCL